MPVIDKENLKEVLDYKTIKPKDYVHGFNLNSHAYSDFNIKNNKAPELLPLFEIIKSEFPNLKSKIPFNNSGIRSIKKFKSKHDYYLTFTLGSEKDVYSLESDDKFTKITMFTINGRKANLDDYIYLLNYVFRDIQYIKKLTI